VFTKSVNSCTSFSANCDASFSSRSCALLSTLLSTRARSWARLLQHALEFTFHQLEIWTLMLHRVCLPRHAYSRHRVHMRLWLGNTVAWAPRVSGGMGAGYQATWLHGLDCLCTRIGIHLFSVHMTSDWQEMPAVGYVWQCQTRPRARIKSKAARVLQHVAPQGMLVSRLNASSFTKLPSANLPRRKGGTEVEPHTHDPTFGPCVRSSWQPRCYSQELAWG